MASVVAFAKSLVIGLAVFLAFLYLGKFSPVQSLAMAVVCGIGYDLYEGLRLRLQAEKEFSSFWVAVAPRWPALLRDYKLIDGDEKWGRLQEELDSIEARGYNVLRDGITFTVLEPGLCFWNSRRRFVSTEEFEERIEEIKIHGPSWSWSPSVYFKIGIRGYELGLSVNADWWKRICAADETKELANTEADSSDFHLTGHLNLVVARLPYAEFGVYGRGNAVGYSLSQQRREEKAREAEIVRAGWKRQESSAELDLLGAPEGVEHKYFTVEHRAI
jgi:hypothetical protein